jgi:hypothetical protein
VKGWRTGSNNEFWKLIKGDVKNITAQRIKWRGHLNRMDDTKLVKKFTDWNPIGIRTKGRSKTRWSDEVINDLKKLKLRNSIQLVKDEKPGMRWCRRAKPMYGCTVRRRRRRRRWRMMRRRRSSS